MAGCYGSGEYPFNIPVTSRFSSESLSTQSSIRSVQQKINSFTRKLEKRHFPSKHNKPSRPSESYKPHGRRYIPHGRDKEREYVPHVQKIRPKLTESGPDWKSRLRRIPSGHSKNYPAEESWPDASKSLRTYPGSSKRTYTEYSFYPELSNVTKRSVFDGIHKASQMSAKEISHTMLFGRGRRQWMIDQRNGLPQASPGDKSYQAVEYSPSFHKSGSTLPVVNFGGSAKPKADTFIPLFRQDSLGPRESFWDKDRRRKHELEERDVELLERWRPATPLIQTIPVMTEQNSVKA